MRGIDPRASRMLSERSTIWATSPYVKMVVFYFNILKVYFFRTSPFSSLSASAPGLLVMKPELGVPDSTPKAAAGNAVYEHRASQQTQQYNLSLS